MLLPSAAVPFTDTTTSGNLVMQPADTPNGGYAIINEANEIELLLTEANPNVEGDGIAEDTVTPLDGVFTITYTGEHHADVWLTDDAEDVRFYRGTDADQSIEHAENSVRLGPSETVTIGLLVDTRGTHDVKSAEEFTVHAKTVTESNGDDGGPRTPYPDETETPSPTATPTPTGAAPFETATPTETETAVAAAPEPAERAGSVESVQNQAGGSTSELGGVDPLALLAVLFVLGFAGIGAIVARFTG